MAVYNTELYLRQALESLVKQTLQEIEIICVDDGSTDSSLEILREYEQRDQRIKAIAIEHEGKGAAHARNVGLSIACGEYISVLDSDDFFEPDMLEKAYTKVKAQKADIIVFDAYLYDQKTDTDHCTKYYLSNLPDTECFSPGSYADKLFFMSGGMAWNALFSRQMILEQELSFYGVNHADDLVFTYLGFACAKKIVILQQQLLHYRRNTGTSQSEVKTQWPESGYLAMYFLKQKLIEKGLYETYKTGYVERALAYAFFYLDTMQTLESFHKLFYDLKNGYLEKLGAFEISDDEFQIQYRVEQRDIIKNGTPEQYLFHSRHGRGYLIPYNDLARVADYLENVPYDKRIVLYGAGNIGKAVFSDIMFAGGPKVLAWVDQKYEKIGFPVQSPQSICTIDFDICVVAIENFDTFKQIKSYLAKQGIEEDKIYWLMEKKESSCENK